jgi:hypothetical protein
MAIQGLSTAVRFWKFVIPQEEGCWEWQGALFKTGYGAFNLKGQAVKAHRVAYTLAHGPFPDELYVCHHCDNPKCVRPDHLFLGTDLDNVRDAITKGRWIKKMIHLHNCNKKLKGQEEYVRKLYGEGASRNKLAKQFNVSWHIINRIIKESEK